MYIYICIYIYVYIYVYIYISQNTVLYTQYIDRFGMILDVLFELSNHSETSFCNPQAYHPVNTPPTVFVEEKWFRFGQHHSNCEDQHIFRILNVLRIAGEVCNSISKGWGAEVHLWELQLLNSTVVNSLRGPEFGRGGKWSAHLGDDGEASASSWCWLPLVGGFKSLTFPYFFHPIVGFVLFGRRIGYRKHQPLGGVPAPGDPVVEFQRCQRLTALRHSDRRAGLQKQGCSKCIPQSTWRRWDERWKGSWWNQPPLFIPYDGWTSIT